MQGDWGAQANSTWAPDVLTPWSNGSTGAKQVAMGSFHSMHLNSGGYNFTSGGNNEGELGIGNTAAQNYWVYQGDQVVDIAGTNVNSYKRFGDLAPTDFT